MRCASRAHRTLAEHAFADQLASQTALLRSLADTVTPADGLQSVSLARLRALADTLGVADSLATLLERQLPLADTLALADQLAFQAAYLRTLSDLVAVLDAVDPRLRAAAAVLNLADAIYLGEQEADRVYAGSVQVRP